MSIMNETMALKQVRKQVKNHGKIGNPNRHFMDEFFSLLGRRPGCNETAFVRAGVRTGVLRGELYVTSDNYGSIIMVEEFDRTKAETIAEPEPVRTPEISTHALLPVVHEILRKKRNSNGVIITGETEPVLIREIHEEVSNSYNATHHQINCVFDAMYLMGLRDNAAKLRRQGMHVFDAPDLYTAHHTQEYDQAVVRADELQGKLDTQLHRNEHIQTRLGEVSSELKLLKKEQEGILEENSTLTDENERLTQANDDLRTRNQALSVLERTIQDAVSQYNESV